MSAFPKLYIKINEPTLAGGFRLLAVFAVGFDVAELLAAAVGFFGAIVRGAEPTADEITKLTAFSTFERVMETFREGSAGEGFDSEASSVRSAVLFAACSAFLAFERVIGTLRWVLGAGVGRGSGIKRISTVEGVDGS